MISFQSEQKRNCVSASNTKRKYKLKTQSTQAYQNKNKKTTQYNKQNLPNHRQSYEAPLSCKDSHKQQLKYLIEHNSNYFQNKIKITDKIRPNQYRFKLPTKTPMTIYKKNFNLKQNNFSVDNLKLNRNNLSQLIKKKQPEQNLLFKSTYQNQFIIKKQNHRSSFNKIKKQKQLKTDQEDQVPRFLQTQNKCFFLNWGGKNPTTSLKPSYQTIATNFPFDGNTVYKNDFQGKHIAPSKIIVPQTSISKLSNSFMINKTCYSSQFTKKQKKPQVQKSYKPENKPIKSSQMFKGNTQYRSEFIKNKGLSGNFTYSMSKQQLSALILDL